MVFLITPSTVCKKFKIQLLALSCVVSVHHTSLRPLNLCIGYLLNNVLILRFVASLIVLCFYKNLIILVLCSAFYLILTLFILPFLAHCYYHTSIKNHVVFVHFYTLHLTFGITYLIMFALHQHICLLEEIWKPIFLTKLFLLRLYPHLIWLIWLLTAIPSNCSSGQTGFEPYVVLGELATCK